MQFNLLNVKEGICFACNKPFSSGGKKLEFNPVFVPITFDKEHWDFIVAAIFAENEGYLENLKQPVYN